VPSPETVLTMPVVLDIEPTLTRDEWALLALVDGRRPVREIVELTGAGQFAVVSTLSRLVERGLLAVRDDVHDHAAVVTRRLAMLAPLERGTTGGRPERGDSGGAEEPAAAEEPEPAAVDAPDAAWTEPQVETVPDVEVTSDHGSEPEGGSESPPAEEPAVGVRPELSPVAGYVPPPGERPNANLPYATAGQSGAGHYEGNVAPVLDPVAIERDPSVNRSLLLRLIAGVRGL
jgi:hypothetical protein